MTSSLATRPTEVVAHTFREEGRACMTVVKRSDAGLIYPQIVESIRGRVLSGAELGRLTGVTERQVHRWVTGESRPEGGSRARLLEVNFVIQGLRDVYTEDGVEIWLHGPNRNLGGRKPVEMLENGEFREVLLEIQRLTVGAD